MRESDKKKVPKTTQTKQSVRTPKRETKPVQENGRKPPNVKESNPKASRPKPASNNVLSDTKVGAEPAEVYDDVVIHYVDDAYRSPEEAVQGSKVQEPTVGDKDDDLEDCSSELSKKGDDSDYESLKGSTSSQDDIHDDEKIDGPPNVSKKIPNKGSSKVRVTPEKSNLGVKQSNSPPSNPVKPVVSNEMAKVPSSELSGGTKDNKPVEETTQDMFEEASNEMNNIENYDDNIGAVDYRNSEQERAASKQKGESMENRIEKLEDELRVVAALEISLYSVIPEHGSSAHKVHTPARRLSRLYIHACKHWTRSKRATIARNTVSGLIFVSKTCGNDLARLTFWLSNTVVLREIISQVFGISGPTSPARFSVSNGSKKGGEGNAFSVKLKGNSSGKQMNKIMQMFEDWEETSTFTSALGKIESWIFSRVVESVWWQALTPNMQTPVEDLISQKSIRKTLGPSLGDQQQGTFSVELWKNAFQGAFERLCPVRAAGHECGCLPVLARMIAADFFLQFYSLFVAKQEFMPNYMDQVMERCVGRLDVAMFNAILRESAHQIPTDPVSDPIADSRVLPIPAGDFSFGSGAQLKNSVGNWSRWFSDHLGMETEDEPETYNEDHQIAHAKTKFFFLLNELSDLLMLPKDMLMDRSVRKEVCPSINLGVIKRILCYFTPDEFCPEPVPGEVLEALNAESFVERTAAAGEPFGSFPYAAPAVSYMPPSSSDVSEKVAEAGGKAHVERNASMVQNKGYMSDEELDDLDSPLTSFMEPLSPSTLQNGNVSIKSKEQTGCGANARFSLLHEVWSL
ncbi:Myosin-H heavy chain [Bienertia sinuspersici]